MGNSLEVSNFEIVILIAKQRKAKQCKGKAQCEMMGGRMSQKRTVKFPGEGSQRQT